MTSSDAPFEPLDSAAFIRTATEELSATVGDGRAVSALSGGVDSAVATALGQRALGAQLSVCFIDNGLMREGEPESVVGTFLGLGVPVEPIDAREAFLYALRGITDPEGKREAITQTFYRTVFGQLLRDRGARFLLQGTNLTDVQEAVAGVKRQHNILAQLGVDTTKEFGYAVLEPLASLRKPAIRTLGRALGLPAHIVERRPFPGPALAVRVIGEVTAERLWLARKATRIVEEELAGTPAFQLLALLHEDRVTGVRGGRRDYGYQIELRCWDSADAVTATPTELPYPLLRKISARLTTELANVVSVTYNITTKPPCTIEPI